MPRLKILASLLRFMRRLGLLSTQTWTRLLKTGLSVLRALATNPQVRELFRFIVLGTIVETGRKIAEKGVEFWREFFVVKAEFEMGDFAYDWVITYLENERLWNESRSFKVVARNPSSRPHLHQPESGKPLDDHPSPWYEPATTQSPALFRWRGYWMTVSKSSSGHSHYDLEKAVGGTLMISLWSRNRHILDEFVSTAREFYLGSQILPRKQLDFKSEPSESLLTASFVFGDLAHDWVLEYLKSMNALDGVMNLLVTTRQSDALWQPSGPQDVNARYIPAIDSMVRFLFTSPRTGKSTWLQVMIQHNGLFITLHSSDRDILSDLVDCAKESYSAREKVSVHLVTDNGAWGRTVTKSRRALSTLLLPAGTKDLILNDAKDFLVDKEWYSRAGIPHRRGYLLYGAPGTGKSSTIHAIAGELGLEIYMISLSHPRMDDYVLSQLISHTPSRCILLLEDIDCAFPSRANADEDEDDEPAASALMYPPKSAVTLSGLLNVLDSVSSEEGRITFATTNHIDNLDPALIRPGRMDLKIKYGLATTDQIEGVFKIFFRLGDPNEFVPVENIDGTPIPPPPPLTYTAEDVLQHATEFAASVPSSTFSIAQIQGYLFTKKRNPRGAVEGVEEWLAAQQLERKSVAQANRKRQEDYVRWQATYFPQGQPGLGPMPMSMALGGQPPASRPMMQGPPAVWYPVQDEVVIPEPVAPGVGEAADLPKGPVEEADSTKEIDEIVPTATVEGEEEETST
ncbi:hypothetical protein FB45DRAFT_927826 [Roridomyces roridus]|uniref:AAA+ ATPase domain-containing protein n=1 Tax=Roridomyces roridus TaxID=1738132 RepID=A0AAD7BJH5_9AGAR|nr:hypothetical protein FB45DRAFT_927826 [Roridomyces roridus]